MGSKKQAGYDRARARAREKVALRLADFSEVADPALVEQLVRAETDRVANATGSYKDKHGITRVKSTRDYPVK